MRYVFGPVQWAFALTILCVKGSGVTVGAKYVIRTEILYEVDKSERVD